MTHRASSRRHVSDNCTGGSDGFPFSVCERTRVQVPSSVEVNDTTSELVVTLLGIFKLSDEFVGCSLLVTYIWKDCIQFFLGLIKLFLIRLGWLPSHPMPEIGYFVVEFSSTVMRCAFMDTGLQHLSLNILLFSKGSRGTGKCRVKRLEIRRRSIKYAFLSWRHAHTWWSVEHSPWRNHIL